MHSLFGISKLCGDLYAQEYARYFGLKTGIFRCGCITGRRHAGVEQHGFLSYMAKCKRENKVYKIYGYKGKQVRDNIHAYDLINAFDYFIQNPKAGEVYNMGGGRHSNISVIEALKKMKVKSRYIDKPRKGDHIWYISDVSKFKNDYPEWNYTYNMEKIIENLISSK
jgi:CDP-paratose 2-epimerase